MKSGIRDNRARGKVADFLQEKAANGSRLSIVSAYFTIYAYEALYEQLDGIDSLKFLFGEPKFIQTLDPEKTDKKAFKIEDEGLELANRLQQKEVAVDAPNGSPTRSKSVPSANPTYCTATRHGQDMSAYSSLLDKTVAAIVAQFTRKNAANLFTGRGGKLMDTSKAVKGNTDFDLITWLVIK